MIREQLLRPGHLAALAVALGLLLVLLRPPLRAFEHPAWVDDLTAAYLGGVLWLQPNDRALRLRLSRQLLHLGRSEEAGRALGPVVDASSRLLRLDIDRAAGAPKEVLLGHLHALAREHLGAVEVERVAAHALGLEQPGLASELYAELGHRVGEGRFLLRAAELALSAGRPAEAGRLYARVADGTTEAAAARRLSQAALAALTAGAKGEEAMGAARRFLARFPSDATLRRQARDVALEQGLLGEAVVQGRALLSARPEDDEARAWLARTAEWARRPALALRHWSALAHHAQGAQFPALLGRAARLARGLDDYGALAALHEEEARRGRLSPEGLDGLLWAYEHLGAPERATALLDGYLDRHRDHYEAWRALGRLRQRLGDRQGARRAWSALRGLGYDDEALLAEVRLLAEDGERGRARALLREAPPRQALQALRGELAWEAGDDGEALAAYRILWRSGGATEGQAERLLRLLGRASAEQELLAVARGELAAGRPAPILGALEELLDHPAGRGAKEPPSTFDGLARLLTPALDGDARMWLLLARRHQSAGRRGPAQAAYERALRLAPTSAPAREGLLWLLIENRDLPALRGRLLDWRNDATGVQGLWRPFAVGHLLLGAPRESAAWFVREWPARADDPAWLRGFAEALDGAGQLDAGQRVRRLAARLGPEPAGQAAIASPQRPPLFLPPGPDLLQTGLDSLNIGPLHLVQGFIGLTRSLGPIGLELRALPTYLTDSEVSMGELDLMLRASLRLRWGRSEIGAGANLRTDGTVPRLQLAQQVDLPGLFFRAELGLGEVAADTAALRLGGMRNRLGLLGRADLTRRLYAMVHGDLRDHRDRLGSPFAQGYTVGGEVGYRLFLSRPALHLRLTGAWAQNRLADSLPPALAALLPEHTAPSGVLPEQLALFGAGLALGRAGGPGERLRYLVELWLGWLWPQQSLGYAARFAIGVPMSSAGEVSLGAHLANNQVGGLGAATWGLGIRYQLLLGRSPAIRATEVPIL